MFGVQATVSEEYCRKYILRELNSIHYDNYNQRIRWERKVTRMGETESVRRANVSVRLSFAKLLCFIPRRIWRQYLYKVGRVAQSV